MINIKMQETQKSEVNKLSPKIAVIGVGGAGGNAVNNMIESNLDGCEFLVCNTDAQALEASRSTNRMQLGPGVTGGLGAGSKPEVGRAAAEETLDEVLKYLDGANMAFVTAGMGGGTGTGAAPVIAKACREKGILTVGVVTKPFHFEGAHRMKQAEAGIEEMQEYVDTLIVIPNQNLFRVADEKTTFADAFKMADSVLQSGVRGVTDLMVRPGLVNLDFADIRTAMLEMGKAMMGTGEASGDKRAVEAAEAAINNPLLDDVSMKGAHGVIINVTGGYDMTLFEADEACNRIRDEVDADANIIFGANFDETMEGQMRVSIVATGIDVESAMRTRPAEGASEGAGGMQRAQPKTTPKTGGGADVNTTATPVSSPISSSVSAPGAGAIADDPDEEMFDQSRYGGQSNAAATDADDGSQDTAMRGTRYRDSFIPPKPVEAIGGYSPDIASVATAQQPAAPTPISSPASSPVAAKSPMAVRSADNGANAGSSLKLNPPRLPASDGTAPKSGAQSLFGRLKGSIQHQLDELRAADEGHAQEAGQKPQATTGPLTGNAAPNAPSQPSLNIDAPSKPKAEDDQLDIPAFLRRQAN